MINLRPALTFAGAILLSVSCIGALAENSDKDKDNERASRHRSDSEKTFGNAVVPHPNLPGSVMMQTDPLAIYKEAGIDQEQERKIRILAKEFEDGQRVRLALFGNLLKEMRDLQFEPDPDERKVLAKQDEINKVQAEMGTERAKLVLKIRSILSFEEKQRLVTNLRLSSRFGKAGVEPSKKD